MKLVDTRDLKSLAEKRAGSIPARGTNSNFYKSSKMKKEDLYHWQDTAQDTQKCDEVFEKFAAAGLLTELAYIIEKRMNDSAADEAYNNTDFSGN